MLTGDPAVTVGVATVTRKCVAAPTGWTRGVPPLRVPRLGCVGADAAAAAGPTALAGVAVRAVDGQGGAADRQHVRRSGGVLSGGAVVAGGGDEGDPGVARGGGEVAVVIAL